MRYVNGIEVIDHITYVGTEESLYKVERWLENLAQEGKFFLPEGPLNMLPFSTLYLTPIGVLIRY